MRSRKGTSSRCASDVSSSGLGRERPVSTKLRWRGDTPTSSARSSCDSRRCERHDFNNEPIDSGAPSVALRGNGAFMRVVSGVPPGGVWIQRGSSSATAAASTASSTWLSAAASTRALGASAKYTEPSTATPSALPSHCTVTTTPPAMPALASGRVPTARATSGLMIRPNAAPVNSSVGSSAHSAVPSCSCAAMASWPTVSALAPTTSRRSPQRAYQARPLNVVAMKPTDIAVYTAAAAIGRSS